jgi:ligand-binding sensor domain-containing protein
LHLQATDIIPITWNIRHHRGDTLWVGTQQGLIWFAEKTKSFGRLLFTHPAVLDSFPITTQFEDSRELIWMGVGNGHGVVCYDPEKNSFTVYNEKSFTEFPLRHPTAITEDENGNLWMGTQKGGGLVKWDRMLNRFTLFSAKRSTSFSDDQINDLYADHRGHIWIATFARIGLLRYDIRSLQYLEKEKDCRMKQISRMRPRNILICG